MHRYGVGSRQWRSVRQGRAARVIRRRRPTAPARPPRARETRGVPADPDVFDNHLAAWDAYLATPWARARYDVVAHVLDETLAQLGPQPLRVLDLGGGDGVDSVRLAAAGHEITIVDQAPGMLGRAWASAQRASCSDRCRTVESDLASWRPDRPYDLVLCHFVLQYLEPEDEHQVWRLLREALRPGGSASVICPNPVSEILRAIYRDGDTELALRRFHGEPVRTPTFDREVRQLYRADGRTGGNRGRTAGHPPRWPSGSRGHAAGESSQARQGRLPRDSPTGTRPRRAAPLLRHRPSLAAPPTVMLASWLPSGATSARTSGSTRGRASGSSCRAAGRQERRHTPSLEATRDRP